MVVLRWDLLLSYSWKVCVCGRLVFLSVQFVFSHQIVLPKCPAVLVWVRL